MGWSGNNKWSWVMATLDVTGAQLKQIKTYKYNGRFLMLWFRGYHIRLDLKGPRPEAAGDGSVFKVSSFHIKRDLDHDTFINNNEDSPRFGRKIVEDFTDYVYFKYVDGGVWQPLWGYYKEEQATGGQVFWKETGAFSDGAWEFACNEARWFLGRLSKVTGTDQGLAMGPVMGPGANVFAQL